MCLYGKRRKKKKKKEKQESKIAGSIPKHLWSNNPDKGTTCFNVFSQPEHTDACMKTLVNPFDMCQIKEFEDLCKNVSAYRTDRININAWANDYTKIYKNLYVPSVFIKDDGIFGWNAVIDCLSVKVFLRQNV